MLKGGGAAGFYHLDEKQEFVGAKVQKVNLGSGSDSGVMMYKKFQLPLRFHQIWR